MSSAPASPPAPADPRKEQAFRAFLRTYGLIDRVMAPHFARFGTSGAQWGVLRTLHRADAEGRDALTVTELGERLIIRPPSVTGIIDRLVRDGMVTRRALATDRRVKQIRLTTKGRRTVEAALQDHGHQIDRLLGGLDAAEQDELARLLSKMSRHLDGLLALATDEMPNRKGAKAAKVGEVEN